MIENRLPGFEFHCDRNDFGRTIDINIFSNTKAGSFSYVSYFTVENGDALDLAPDPSIRLSPDQAAQLMDELWRCGARPSAANIRSLTGDAAMGNHLADMRAIAFNCMRMEKP